MIRPGLHQQRDGCFDDSLQSQGLALYMGVVIAVEAGGNSVHDGFRNHEASWLLYRDLWETLYSNYIPCSDCLERTVQNLGNRQPIIIMLVGFGIAYH